MGLLLLVSVVASPLAKRFINRKLANLPDYHGHVETVNVALWRGAAELKDFVLYDRAEEDKNLPAVRMKRAAFWIDYGALFGGTLGGKAVVESAEINVIKRREFDGPIDAAKEAKDELREKKEMAEPWREALRKTFPIEITSMEVKDTKVRFIDRAHEPNVDVGITGLNMRASGLRTRPKEGEGLPSSVELTGLLTGNGKLKVTVQADPLAEKPHFNSAMELRELSLPPFNSFLHAYTDTDVSSGVFELYTEMKAENGAYHGYVKPFFKDLDFKTSEDKDKNIGQKIKEAAADVVTTVLKNDDKQKVATETPISGNFEENNADVWTTIVNLLRNAFVQSLKEGLGAETPRKR